MKARVNERPRQLGKSAVSLAVPGAKATARNAKQLYSVRIVTRSVLDTARSQRSACCWFASGGTPQQAYRGVAAGVRDALLCLLAPCACRLCSRRTAAAVVVRQHAAFNHACSGSVLCHPAATWNSPQVPPPAAALHSRCLTSSAAASVLVLVLEQGLLPPGHQTEVQGTRHCLHCSSTTANSQREGTA